jgi:hypothetical protein
MTITPIPDLRRVGMALLRQRFPAQLGSIPIAGGKEILRVRDAEVDNLREFLAQHDYFARVGLIPGRTTPHGVSAALDFDIFALTDSAAGDLSRAIDAWLMDSPLALRVASGPLTGASLDTVVSQMSPDTVPWADAGVRRYYSSYAVTARR